MSKVYTSVTELIGRTPLIELVNIEKKYDLKAKVVAKLELFNPAGSVKDRVARAMVEDAEKSGKLKKGSTIIEPTSGNTGIGLASVATAKGYKTILTMPETMSVERRNLLKAYGAEIVLTDGTKGMSGAIAKAKELEKEIDGGIILGQFDFFVAGVGTGGTLSGVGNFLKSKKADVKVVAVEPQTSPVLSEGHGGPHKIQGIGAGFVPDTLDTKVYDEILPIANEAAFSNANDIAKTEGILVGISSGAALAAAIELAKREENAGKTIVALFPDTGERYLSTGVFNS